MKLAPAGSVPGFFHFRPEARSVGASARQAVFVSGKRPLLMVRLFRLLTSLVGLLPAVVRCRGMAGRRTDRAEHRAARICDS